MSEKKGWLSRLKSGLKKSSESITSNITTIFTHKKLDEQALEQLEEALIMADLGVTATMKITQKLAKEKFGKEVTEQEIKEHVAESISEILTPVAHPLEINPAQKPHVILVVGVNGSGKTTTIAKLSKQWKDQGLKLSIAAGDTFRAAAVEQLKVWGDRLHVPVISREIGADAAGLAYDAYEQARRNNDDVLLIDTAGRLHNNANLMAELQKIRKVLKKIDSMAPHTCLLILDATIGQNAHQQVDTFKEMTGVSGLIMTKLDGSAKGGVVVSLAEKYKLPVHALGVGESSEDLQAFKADDFSKGLLGI